MFKVLLRNIFAFIVAMAMVPAAMALGGSSASGVEPGDGCEADPVTNPEGTLFKRAPGAPFSGVVMATYDNNTADVVIAGNELVQFGSGCTMQVAGKLTTIQRDDFDQFKGRDLVGICLSVLDQTNCDDVVTSNLEVLVGRNPAHLGDVVTVEIMGITPTSATTILTMFHSYIVALQHQMNSPP